MAYQQAAYLTKKLQAAKSDFAAADEARKKLAQRDREVSVTMADMHRDMAGHVVRLISLFVKSHLNFPALCKFSNGAHLSQHAITRYAKWDEHFKCHND